jgi:hypothetical protein
MPVGNGPVNANPGKMKTFQGCFQAAARADAPGPTAAAQSRAWLRASS